MGREEVPACLMYIHLTIGSAILKYVMVLPIRGDVSCPYPRRVPVSIAVLPLWTISMPCEPLAFYCHHALTLYQASILWSLSC